METAVEVTERQTSELVSSQHGYRDGAGTETQMNRNTVKEAFTKATSATKYKAALAQARKLKGKDQLAVLDSMFTAANRLGVQRSTGEPLGMQQEIDGNVTVTWQTKCTRPDGSSFRVVQSAVLEPNDYGAGWRSRTKDVPEEVMNAVTSAAMADELRPRILAARRRRVYVR